MKLLTAFALVSIGMAGAACSEAAAPDQAAAADAPKAEVQTVAVEEPAGTFNLNIGGADDDAESGGFNLNLGDDNTDDGLMIGRDGFGEADFGEEPVLDLDLEGEDPLVPSEDDDIVRLD